MAKTPNALSEGSIDALLGDLRHVVDGSDPSQWATLAVEVLEHHSPPIEEALLSMKAAKLQHWCRTMLEAMSEVDEDATREAAKMVKRYS